MNSSDLTKPCCRVLFAERGHSVKALLASVGAFGLVLSGAFAPGAARAAEADEVQLNLKGDSLDVTVDGKPFTVYHFAKTQKKPYFWPVRGPEGQIMTRAIVKPT